MSRKLVSVDEDTARWLKSPVCLKRTGSSVVPVLADGKLVGLISRANLLRGLAVARPAEIRFGR